jgi:hypothetical protein
MQLEANSSDVNQKISDIHKQTMLDLIELKQVGF